MKTKQFYKNGQPVLEQNGYILTYFYKNGNLKARGISIEGVMEGEWIFYRENGQLWQTAGFKSNAKHGRWLRYNRNDQVEYDEIFDNGKKLKR